MATTPSTIIVCSTDKVLLPLQALHIIVKQIFQYGIKDISLKGDKICIALTYSPKDVTLTRKFGNLPVKYIRTKIETEEELKVLEKVLKRFHFNLHQDDQEELEQAVGSSSSRKNRNLRGRTTTLKLEAPPPSPVVTLSSSDEDEVETQPPPKGQKRSAPAQIFTLSSDDEKEEAETQPPPKRQKRPAPAQIFTLSSDDEKEEAETQPQPPKKKRKAQPIHEEDDDDVFPPS